MIVYSNFSFYIIEIFFLEIMEYVFSIQLYFVYKYLYNNNSLDNNNKVYLEVNKEIIFK